MATEKKCANCGKWGPWQKQPSDRCIHCGEYLDEAALKHKLQQEEADRLFRENDFFRIREEDGFVMRTVRRTGWVLHAIFAAITWAFLWFVTTFSG